MRVERIGRLALPISKLVKLGCACVPIRNAVAGRMLNVEVACSFSRFLHETSNSCAAAKGLQFCIFNRRQKLQLFCKTAHRPSQAPRPGAEGRVALLRVRAPVITIVHIEDTLVCGSSPYVVEVPAFSVVNRVLCCCLCMLNQAPKQ